MAEFIQKTDTLNEGRVKLNAAIQDAKDAKITAEDADDKAMQALAKSESTQTQLDTIVIEGDSSVEAAQARVDASGNPYTTLKERLDSEHTQVTAQLAQKANLSDLPLYNPEWFGIKADGEDYAQELKELFEGGNKYIDFSLLGEGEIYVSQTIYLESNTVVTGSNKIRFTQDDGYPIFETKDYLNTQQENIVLENIVFDGKGDYYSGGINTSGINIVNAKNVTIRNITMKNFAGASPNHDGDKISPFNVNYCDGVLVEECHLEYIGFRGISMFNTRNAIIRGNRVIGSHNTGIQFRGDWELISELPEGIAENIYVYNNIVENTMSYNLASDGAIDCYRGGRNIVVRDNIVTNFGMVDPVTSEYRGSGIRLSDASNSVVVNNIIKTGQKALNGISLTDRPNKDMVNVICTGNYVEIGDECATGIRVWGDAQRERFTITDNIVVGLEDSSFTEGLIGVNADNSNVQNNTLEKLGATTAGIRVRFNRRGLNISNNTLINSNIRIDVPSIIDSIISNNIINGNGVWLTGAKNVTISNNIIGDEETTNNRGIEFEGVNSNITSNMIKNLNGHGILINSGDNNRISGNIVDDVGLLNGNFAGIQLLEGNDNTITENRIRTPQARWGIRLHASVPTNTLIMYNDVRGSGTENPISAAGETNIIQTSDY